MKISVNGVELYYEKHGRGRPLIMTHCNSRDHRIFYEAAEVLRKYFTVYLISARNHGTSTRLRELHYSDMAEDMVAFMTGLDLRDVVYYGFSDGGIAGLLAAMKSDRIGMLITSGANLTPEGVKLPIRILSRLAHLVTRDPRLRLMLTEPNIRPDELAKIKVPTVVIAGERDMVTEKETMRIAASIPGAKMRILPGEWHGSYIVHKRRIADIILSEVKSSLLH